MLLIAEPILAKYQSKPIQPKTLAIVLVGENPAAELYVGIKTKKAESYGIKTKLYRLADTVSTSRVQQVVHNLNADDSVNAVIVQLPLPKTIDTTKVLESLNPGKDVDNLSGERRFTSPMVQAVRALANEYQIDFTGKKVCVVGFGRLIGHPMTVWLESQGIFPDVITDANEFSSKRIKQAEIVIGGTGQKHLITADCVHANQVIFDCSGVDVDFEAVKDRVYAISPPKGGIGPLTVHFLLINVLQT